MRNSFLVIGIIYSVFTSAQKASAEAEIPSLKDQIMRMDSLLFSEAFNKCNFELYQTIMADGMEFYDDRTGLNESIEKEYASFQDKCSRPFEVTRQLVECTVHPLGDFGAVQIGSHIFLNDNVEVQVASFITIWENRGETWVVKRALSYDHRDL